MDATDVTVTGVREVGPDTVALDLDTPDGFSARPGQFVKLSASLDGEQESRFYTVSSPDTDGTFEVTVGVDPEGTLAPWLAERVAGDTVTVVGPYGDAFYDGEARVVVVAGGPGVGPAVGIAERALAAGNEAAVVYRDDAPVHEERLAALAAAGAEAYVLGADDDLASAVAATATGAPGEQVFVYGFAAFLDAATAALDAAGVDPGDARTENFG